MFYSMMENILIGKVFKGQNFEMLKAVSLRYFAKVNISDAQMIEKKTTL